MVEPTQRDVFPGITRDPLTLSAYGYARQNPLSFADPSGAINAAVLGTAVHRKIGEHFVETLPASGMFGIHNYGTLENIRAFAEGYASDIPVWVMSPLATRAAVYTQLALFATANTTAAAAMLKRLAR